MGLADLLKFQWRELYYLSSGSTQRRTKIKLKETIDELNPYFVPLGK